MKKIILYVLMISLFCLCSCGKETVDTPSVSVDASLIENETTESAVTNVYSAETEFLELFEECYALYKKEGITANLQYAKLEDIYQANTDNEMMKNLYFFCSACGYYRLAEIIDDESYKESGDKEAAKIDPNYDGPYAKEVISFAKELLGDAYADLADSATKEQENYENLTMQDKKDILNYITSNENNDADALWDEIANKYGISTEHVSLINTDIDVITAVGQERKEAKEQASANLEYDATLEYGTGSVVIANSKDDLSTFLSYVSEQDNDALGNMVANGLIAYVEKGTKINVIEKKFSTAKIKILEGIYEGVECWTIIEAVQEK